MVLQPGAAQDWGRAWGFDGYECIMLILLVFLLALHWALHNRRGFKGYLHYSPYLIIPFIIYLLGAYIRWSGKWPNVTGRTLDSRWFIIPFDSPWLILGISFVFIIAGIFVAGMFLYKTVDKEDVKGWTKFPSTLGLGFGWMFYGFLMLAILGIGFPAWKVIFGTLLLIVIFGTLINYILKGRKFGFTNHAITVFFVSLAAASFFFLLARLIEPISILLLILTFTSSSLAGLIFTALAIKKFYLMQKQQVPEFEK